MTDLPAVVYLKAEVPSTEGKGDILEREDNCHENTFPQKFKPNKISIRSPKRQECYKRLLEALNSAVLKKLDKVEERIDTLSDSCDILEEKVNALSSYLETNIQYIHETSIRSAETSHISQNRIPAVPISSKVTYITINSEDDFPNGSWLGFENNPEMRVRCNISPSDLYHINWKYSTPEKMALTLLDHLFDRETQASSNISGMGKHKKKQLDPLLIYGIKCHLICRFDINEDDWIKVKIHMDSKCRTAFRRKLKGMPLNPRKHNSIPTNVSDYSASRDSRFSNSSTDQEMSCENFLY